MVKGIFEDRLLCGAVQSTGQHTLVGYIVCTCKWLSSFPFLSCSCRQSSYAEEYYQKGTSPSVLGSAVRSILLVVDLCAAVPQETLVVMVHC